MQQGNVATRLRRKLRLEGWASLALGGGMLVLTFLAAIFAFWAVYVAGFFFFGFRGMHDNSHLWISLGVVGFLFLVHELLDPQQVVHVEVPDVTDPEGPPIELRIRRQDGDSSLDPNSTRDALRYVLGAFFFAPMLLRLALETIHKGVRLLTMDLVRLAPVMELLAGRTSRTPFAEIFGLFPYLNPQWLVHALHDLEGVTFLNTFPAGVILSSELRQELGQPVPDDDESAASNWPEESGPPPDYSDEAGTVPATVWETEPTTLPRPKLRRSELAITLIVRFVCGCILGSGVFCLVVFAPHRYGSGGGRWRANWFDHPSWWLPFIFVFGGGVICVLSTPRWMWRGGLG